MSERLLITVDKSELESCDFEDKLQTLSLQVKQGLVVVNATQLPALVRIVHASRLQDGHWCKLERCELNHTLGEVECCNLTCVLVCPVLLLSIINGNLDFCSVLAHVYSFWDHELDFDSDVSAGMRGGVWIRNGLQALLYSQDRSHCPLGGLLALLWVLIHSEVDYTTDDKVVLDLMWGQVVIASPESAQDELTAGLLLRELCDMVTKLDVLAIIVTAEHISPDSEQDVPFWSNEVKCLFTGLVAL